MGTREAIWLQGADGNWVLVEALLDTGEGRAFTEFTRLGKQACKQAFCSRCDSIAAAPAGLPKNMRCADPTSAGSSAGLSMSTALAQLLGYADALGRPHPRYAAGSAIAFTEGCAAASYRVGPVAYWCVHAPGQRKPHVGPCPNN